MKAWKDFPHLPWWKNPYLHLILNALSVTVSEVCLKLGADETAGQALAPWISWLGLHSLGSLWVIIGIVFYILSFAFWLNALRHVPLNIAFNLVNISYVSVPLACAILLGEHIGLLRAVGILLVSMGIYIIARPLVVMEEKL